VRRPTQTVSGFSELAEGSANWLPVGPIPQTTHPSFWVTLKELALKSNIVESHYMIRMQQYNYELIWNSIHEQETQKKVKNTEKPARNGRA
jgi:hypothetical protein